MELMELMELMAMASPMPDMAMPVLAMLLPTPTMKRGLLMLSLRLMLMLTTMELTVLAMPDMAMLLPTPMDMASKKSTTSDQSRPPSTNAEAQKQTKYDIQCHYKSFVNLSRNWSRA